ncbi:hypothetical protein ElyMa_005269700 [Elysia marginata]|uniref:Uncharacterized protein n=1 Tax=Elysia marginata TaxID=1093978 RepID=A0AAV4K118_9GAST|nr:hypothetical protein ElyMa_005269700 [Elysia marginata]
MTGRDPALTSKGGVRESKVKTDAPPAIEPNKGTQVISPTAAAPGLPRGGRPKPTSDQPIEQYGSYCTPVYD